MLDHATHQEFLQLIDAEDYDAAESSQVRREDMGRFLADIRGSRVSTVASEADIERVRAAREGRPAGPAAILRVLETVRRQQQMIADLARDVNLYREACEI